MTTFALVLLLTAGAGDETMESLLQKLRSEEPEVRAVAAVDLVDAWERWKDEDLGKLEQAALDKDPELSGRAREAGARIRIRRKIGATLFPKLLKPDTAFLWGDDHDKIAVLRRAKNLWKDGKIQKEDLAGLEYVTTHARWDDQSTLDEFLKEAESHTTFAVPASAAARATLRVREVEQLGSEGKKRSGQVAEFLGDSAPEVRTTALRVMGGIQARELAPHVAALLRDGNAGVRSEALELLGAWGAREFAPDFAKLLDDPNRGIRFRATVVLGAWGEKDSGTRIVKLLRDPFGPMRAEAAAALGAFGAREFAAEITPLLKDPQPMVRQSAAYALGRFGDVRVATRLQELIQDRDAGVRLVAAQALGQLGAGAHADAVVSLLRDDDDEVRSEAAWVLGFAASKEAVGQIVRLLRDRDPDVRHGAVWTLGLLKARDARAAVSELLSDRFAWIRAEAVVSLGRIGGAGDAPAIEALLRDPDRKVRVSAALALGELGGGDARGALAGLERDPDRLLGLSSMLSLVRQSKVDPAAERRTLREVATNDLAFACLGTAASDIESSVHGREAWEILQRPLRLRRSIETWSDLSAALSDAGLTLELQTDGMLGRMDQSQSLSGRDALAWLLGRFSSPVVVLEGRKVRLMTRRDAVSFWEKKLDGK